MLKAVIVFAAVFGCAYGEEEDKALCFPWFDEINGKCYYFSASGEEKTWHGARDICSSYGGELAVMGTSCQEDITFLQAVALKGIQRTWVGASDLAIPGKWRWVDGRDVDAFFLSWYPTQPTTDQDYDCAYLEITATPERVYMHSGLCQTASPFICEIIP